MSNSILVRHIQSLTDARYFAAMEVDWLSLPLNEDPSSFHRWHTLREWIEGPKLAAEVSSDDESLFARTIIDARPDGLVLNHHPVWPSGGIQLFIESNQLSPQVIDPGVFILLDFNLADFDLIRDLPKDHIYLQAEWNPESIIQLRKNQYAGGVCFECAAETTTGIRDFTLMDQMIELLKS